MAKVSFRRGKWVLDYRAPRTDPDTGKTIMKRIWETTQGNRQEAERLLADRLTAMGRGEYQHRKEFVTINELVQLYWDGHVTVRCKPSTQHDYKKILMGHVLPHFGPFVARDLQRTDIENFRARKVEAGVGARTINKALTLLSMMVNYAVDSRLMTYNPAENVQHLKTKDGSKHDLVEGAILAPSEVTALLAACDPKWKPIVMTAIYTGLRQGELFALTWDDVDWLGAEIYVRRTYSHGRFQSPKSAKSRRRVPMPGVLMAELRRWKLACPKGDDNLVFPNGAGHVENPANLINRGFHPALRRAGLRRIRFHDLRHTYASLLIHNGENFKTISELLGHSSITITLDVYGHLLPQARGDVARRLDTLLGGVGSDSVVNGGLSGGVIEGELEKSLIAKDEFGGPCKIRTYDQEIKSLLLYQLS